MNSKQTSISEIQFYPIKPKDGLLGFVSFVVDEKFWVGSVAVYTRQNGGYRLVYPTKKIGSQNLPIIHPINHEAGSAVETAINEKVSELFNENYEPRESAKNWEQEL